MDPFRDRAADAKPRRRGSGASDRLGGGGGSKKSSRQKSSSSSTSTMAIPAGARGDPAGGHDADVHGESSVGGGLPARADLATYSDPDGAAAQGKVHARSAAGSGSRKRTGAKGVRTASGHYGGGEVETEEVQRERLLANAESGLGGGGGGAGTSVDRAILQKWRSDATAPVGNGQATEQDTPAEVEAEEHGDDYDDEGFEEYSDEFNGDDDGPPGPAGAATGVAAATIATFPVASAIRPGSARGGGGGGAMVSSALKTKKTGDLQAPDEKAFEELRNSLREENIVARERKVARPSINAQEKGTSGSEQTGRGAKGAKGSRSAAAAAAGAGSGTPSAGVARGTFSLQEPAADAKPDRSSSRFKMGDAKALTRALAKGDPRTARVLAIRAASRMEVESFRLFDQAPVLPVDLYHRRLRGQPARIRQAGSQTNEDARSVEAQTDEIGRADKEVQFHLGHDDTALENLMRRLRSNRRPSEERGYRAAGGEEKGQERTVVDDGDGDDAAGGAGSESTTTFKGLYSADRAGEREEFSTPRYGADVGESGSGRGATGVARIGGAALPPPPLRLGKFLRQVGFVMETLCEENLLHASVRAEGGGISSVDPKRGGDGGSGSGDDRDGRLLFSLLPDNGEGWEELGGAHASAAVSADRYAQEEKQMQGAGSCGGGGGGGGLGGILKGSEVVGVEFSRVKRSMLVTAHARLVGQRRGRENGEAKDGDDSGRGGDEVTSARGPALEGCGVVCEWNTENVKAGPVNVLCGEGIFSCLCLAPHQPHIVVVGTAEGCLLLWDLREPASSSRAAESRELGLHSGIRPPTYTTAGASGGTGGDAGLRDPGCGHASAIVSVVPIPVAEAGGLEGGGGGVGGVLSLGEASSFQIASLDDRGTLSIWLANEVPKGDEGGSQTDLGLSPGGRVRLTLSKSLRPGVPLLVAASGMNGGISGSERPGQISAPLSFTTTTIGRNDGSSSTAAAATADVAPASARALAFSPADPNRFLVGGSSDRVTHASRLGNPPPPRAYLPSSRRRQQQKRWDRGFAADRSSHMGAGVEGPGQEQGRQDCGEMGGVTCLAFSPFFQEYFLTGYGDGSVRLYKDDSATPLMVWEAGFSAAAGAAPAPTSTGCGGSSMWPAAILSISWSEHRPAVFFVLDGAGTLHAFDVLEDDGGPVASAPCPPTVGTGATRRSLPVWSGSKASTLEAPWCAPEPAFALSSESLATGSRPRVALTFGGRVFIRTMAGRMFRQPIPRPVVVGRVGTGLIRSEGETMNERERMDEWLREVL